MGRAQVWNFFITVAAVVVGVMVAPTVARSVGLGR